MFLLQIPNLICRILIPTPLFLEHLPSLLQLLLHRLELLASRQQLILPLQLLLLQLLLLPSLLFQFLLILSFSFQLFILLLFQLFSTRNQLAIQILKHLLHFLFLNLFLSQGLLFFNQLILDVLLILIKHQLFIFNLFHFLFDF